MFASLSLSHVAPEMRREEYRVQYIHIDADELGSAVRLLEIHSPPRSGASASPTTGRPTLDRAVAAADSAWNAAPSADDGRELATRVRLARDDAATAEDAIVALIRSAGRNVPI
jgi:hypothetical protein